MQSPLAPHELEEALSAWRALLGQDRVVHSRDQMQAAAHITTDSACPPIAVLRVKDSNEVAGALRVANQHGVQLYPISRGHNWGYTDAAAPHPRCAMLDLSGMNLILEIDPVLGYAVIEPGVTQQQLYDAVASQAPGFWIDATGAGPDASILGNALDRGFGHTPYGDHVRTACALEVVLADGAIINTGFSRFPEARAANVYPYGVGPMLDGLFSQSNFGVVTRMTVWLWPRPEAFQYFFILLQQDCLESLVDTLRPLRMQGVLNGALHIGNDLRVVSALRGYPWHEANGVTPLPETLRGRLRKEAGIGLWNVSGALTGTRGHVRDAKRKLKQAVRHLGARIVFVDDKKLALAKRLASISFGNWGRTLRRQLAALEPNYGLLQGKPTSEPLRAMRWRLRSDANVGSLDPHQLGCGLLWLSPVLPLRGEDARNVLRIIIPILGDAGFDAPVTFTMLNERSAVCIVNISYDRSIEGEAQLAQSAYENAQHALMAAGYYPYRTSYFGAAMLPPSPAHDEFIARLRIVLDPNTTLAPRMPSPPREAC